MLATPSAGAAASQSRERRARREDGRGFYAYDARGKPIKDREFARPRSASSPTACCLPLINEAVACLHEGVVADADLLDAGVVFGAGFAPFTGGPIRYATAARRRDIVAKLAEALPSVLGRASHLTQVGRSFLGEA